MNFVHSRCAAIVIVKWQRSGFGGKDTNSVLHCCNNKCGVTTEHDVNGARNTPLLLEKMIQKER
jgi:hypothetical protein